MQARIRVYLLVLLCSGCAGKEQRTGTPVAEDPPSKERPAPPSISDWKTSVDGLLSLRITAPETRLRSEEPIPLVAELRNNSDEPINVIRPFGDWYYAVAAGVHLNGPQGKIDYSGETPSYELGTDSFCTLKPSEVIEDRTELPLDQIAGSDATGKYTLSYEYVGQGWQETASRYGFDALWTGKIESGSVAVVKAENANNRAERFEQNVEIVLPQAEHTFRLSEVADGVKFNYEIVVKQDFDRVIPLPQDAGMAQGPGPSGLYPFESVAGNGDSYSLADIGLGEPDFRPRTINRGTYPHFFEWDGRNWGGPSDTSNPKGDPFPPGKYTFQVRLVGEVVTHLGNKPYEIVKTAIVILKP